MKIEKLISLFMVLILVVGTLGVSALADSGIVNAAYNALTVESLTNEPMNAITKNLVLPTQMNGVAISWATSNTTVINTDGMVTRQMFANTNATLTASLSDGTDSLTKSFSFTVLKQTIKVNYSDNFYYPALKGMNASGNLAGYSMMWGTQEALYNTKVAQENEIAAEKNYVLRSTKNSDTSNTNRTVYTFASDSKPAGTVVIQTKAKFEIGNTTPCIFDLYVRGKTSGGTSVDLIYNRFNFTASNTVAMLGKDGATNGTLSPNTSVFSFKRNEWVTIRWEINMSTGKYNLYVDNQLANYYNSGGNGPNYPLTLGGTAAYIDDFYYYIDRSTPSVTVAFDDTVVSSELSKAAFIATLGDEERVNTYASFIESSVLTSERPYELMSDLNLNTGTDATASGVNLQWTSSNESVISINNATQKGVITRSNVAKPVTITATVSSGNAQVTKSFPFVVAEAYTTKFASADFVGGTVGEDIACTGVSGTATKGFIKSGGSTFKYASDNNYTGTVGEFSASAGTEELRYWNGYTGTEKRYIVETDIQLIPNQYGNCAFDYGVVANGYSAYVRFDYISGQAWVYSTATSTGGTTYRFNIPASGAWIPIKVDVNFLSETYIVYVNGQMITQFPLTVTNSITNGNNVTTTMRGVRYAILNGGTMRIGNFSIHEYPDANTKVNAGAANIAKSLGTSIVAAGPLSSATDITGVTATWSGENVLNNVLSLSSPSTINLTATATDGTLTDSLSFTRAASPVLISNITYLDAENNTATHALSNGTINTITVVDNNQLSGDVIVAVYDGAKLYRVFSQNVSASGTMSVNIKLPENVDNVRIKAFTWDTLNSAKPLSFVFN